MISSQEGRDGCHSPLGQLLQALLCPLSSSGWEMATHIWFFNWFSFLYLQDVLHPISFRASVKPLVITPSQKLAWSPCHMKPYYCHVKPQRVTDFLDVVIQEKTTNSSLTLVCFKKRVQLPYNLNIFLIFKYMLKTLSTDHDFFSKGIKKQHWNKFLMHKSLQGWSLKIYTNDDSDKCFWNCRQVMKQLQVCMIKIHCWLKLMIVLLSLVKACGLFI